MEFSSFGRHAQQFANRFEGIGQFMNRQKFSPACLMDFTPLSKQQKNHLCKVYGTILVGIFSSALGVHIQNNIFSIYMWVSVIMQVVCGLGVAMTAKTRMPSNQVLSGYRGLFYLGFSFFMGTVVAPALRMVDNINPSIVPTAFIGSLAIFVCFSLSAMCARERSYLFLGPILGSALSFGLLLSYIRIFFHSNVLDSLSLYGGLFVYMGFVIYDTQITLEEHRRGNNDYLMHALELYTDLFAIFIRLVSILAEREKRRRDDR